MNKRFVIAIDGGGSTGKGTIARKLAERLGITYIDTGAMYRAVGLYFHENNIEISEENAKKYIDNIDIDMTFDDCGNTHTFLNSKDVSDDIRKNEISMMASNVSKIPLVRVRLVDMQRKMAENKSVVMEGRDIGTVVFPNADIKLYIVVDIDERARRRRLDLLKKGEDVPVEKIKEDLYIRDNNDMNREASPLKKADDSIEFNNTHCTIDEAIDSILKIIKEKKVEIN